MKTLVCMLTAAALSVAPTFATTVAAADAPHEHSRKGQGGPSGGRLLETEPHAEFLIEKDRSVTVRFFTDDLKPVAAAGQTVTVLADPKAGKTRVEFEKSGAVLKSKTRLPEGDGYNLVVQVRSKPDAKPQNFRFKLDLATCGECKRGEYACICAH